MRRLFPLALILAACSGDGDDGNVGFSPCGGDAIAGWDLTASELTGSTDMCTGGVSGFIFFNPNGRYSLGLDIKDWKKTPTDACGFNPAYGGFYRVDGTKICLGDSSVEGAGIPCDGSRPTSQHAVVDFCVRGDQLQLSSDHFLSARVPTLLTLMRRP